MVGGFMRRRLLQRTARRRILTRTGSRAIITFSFSRRFSRRINGVIKCTNYSKAVKYPVCARSHTASELGVIASLKSALQSKTTNLRCPARFLLPYSYHSNIGKRSVDQAAIIAELRIDANSIITPISCINRGYESSNTLNMCKVCQYNIELPDTYFPRYHTHFICGNGNDLSCLCGEGACVKTLRTVTTLHDEGGSGFGRKDMSTWTEKSFTFTAGCACEVISGGLFHPLV